METKDIEKFIFDNAPDGTEDVFAVPSVTQEAVYIVEYFGRADVFTALYTLIAQSWLPHVIVDIKYIEGDDPSEPADKRISKGFNRDSDFTWEDLIAEERKTMQINCHIFPDIDDLSAYITVSYSYLSELKNNGHPQIQADFRQVKIQEGLQRKIFDILRSAGIGVS